jgi:hypothetical protein
MTSTIHREGRHDVPKKHGGDIRRRGVRCVCIKCNSGWMSSLQERAKPIVETMLDLSAFTLTQEAQSVLSAWIAMAVITAEYMDKTKVAIPDSERQYLYLEHSAPKDWGIWIARHEPSPAWRPRIIHQILHISEDGDGVIDSGTRTPNTQATTYKVGNILIHAMSCFYLDIVAGLPYSILFPRKVFRVWPFRSEIRWPSAPIDDREAFYISTQFFETIHRIGSTA